MPNRVSYLSENSPPPRNPKLQICIEDFLNENYLNGNNEIKNSIEAFKNQDTKFLVISFSSDWLYTTKENKDIVIALNASGADVSYSEIVTDKGHDSFLLNEPEFLKTLKGFIDSMYEKFKNEKRI